MNHQAAGSQTFNLFAVSPWSSLQHHNEIQKHFWVMIDGYNLTHLHVDKNEWKRDMVVWKQKLKWQMEVRNC